MYRMKTMEQSRCIQLFLFNRIFFKKWVDMQKPTRNMRGYDATRKSSQNKHALWVLSLRKSSCTISLYNLQRAGDRYCKQKSEPILETMFKNTFFTGVTNVRFQSHDHKWAELLLPSWLRKRWSWWTRRSVEMLRTLLKDVHTSLYSGGGTGS